MKEKSMINLIIKELLFILTEWIIFFITFALFHYISAITGLNPGIILVGIIVWIIGLLIVGVNFLKKEDEICTVYKITRLKLGLITFLTLIITNIIFSTVIFSLGNYGKIPFEIYSEYDFLIYMAMSIFFIIVTILVLGIGCLIKATKRKSQ